MDPVFSLFGLKTSGIVGALTITKTGTTARTVTFPDAAMTVAGSAAALTSGRVPYATTGGLLTDSAALLFTGTLLTYGDGTGSPSFVINSAAGNVKNIRLSSAGSRRWEFGGNNVAESGSDAGTPWILAAYNDSGSFIDIPVTVLRAAGTAITLARPVTCTGAVTVPNGTAAAPGLRVTSEASGLYRIGATSVGISIAGTLALTVAVGGEMTLAATSTASTTSGALQRETNQSKLYTFDNGIGGWIDKCLFSQYATVSQAGIVTDQSLASATARGTRTLPANFFKAGKVLKFRLCGRYTTDAASGNGTIQIKLGSTVFRTSGSFGMDNSVTALPWTLEGEIVCQTTGVTGTVEGVAVWEHMITGAVSNYDAENLGGTAAVTIDTTASQVFDVLWTATDAGTTLTCTCFRLWEVC